MEEETQEGFTPEEKEGWKKVFDDHDTDGSGFLTKDEVINVMRCCKQNPEEDQVDKIMKAFDKNSDDKIDFDEFCSFMKMMPPNPGQSLEEALCVFENDEGVITREKLKEILGGGDDIDEILEAADVNNDGKIDKTEFTNIIQYGIA